MNFTENALKVLKTRYLARDENGNIIETPEGLFERVAEAIAKADKLYDRNADVKRVEEEFYRMMTNLDFLPNSPTLMNAGRPLGQLSACFVLPVGDSMEEIFDAVKDAALIHKSGGGTGFSFSRIRPKGSPVKTTGGIASGPVSFMKVFNAATEAVKQGGRRRGANMGILRVDHPDILEFIQCKRDNKDITNFNISVGITENFMKAVIHDQEYELIDPHTQKFVKRLKARDVFDLIVDMAWNNGEPGIVFLDRINKDNVVPEMGEIESTNPCGEQPLLPHESCVLGSINLANMVKQDGKAVVIDYDKLGQTVKSAVHFLDNVIDVNEYPLPVIEDMTKRTRKIGLGVMGFADMLIKLGVPYNSDNAVEIADKVMGFIDSKSKEASRELAKARGVFPYYEKSIYKDKGLELRNATTTTIAPTGTISIIAGVSSGIEPLFALAFVRNVLDNQHLIEVNPLFKDALVKMNMYSDDLMEEIIKRGTLDGIEGIPDDLKKMFVTAHDIDPFWHIKMQATFQNHTDNAVSKTVNFRHDATRDDVREVYMLAYELGCKGVTIYRDGSRDSQVINVGAVNGSKNEDNKENSRSATLQSKIIPRPRPEVTKGYTEKVKIGCGNLYVTVNYDDKGICEVFTNLGRAGGCPSQSEATSRLVSIALRSGIDVKEIVGQLKGIRCLSTIRQKERDKNIKVLSCPDAIAKVIQKVIWFTEHDGNKQMNGPSDKTEFDEVAFDVDSMNADDNDLIVPSLKDFNDSKGDNCSKCPECGSVIEHEGGCVICRNCGYSKCN